MIPSIEISFKGNEIIDSIAKNMPKVALRALNKVGRSAEVQANRAIRQEFNISRKDVDIGLSVRTASISDLSFKITAKGRPFSWKFFNAKWFKRSGARAKILKARFSKMPHAFEATMKSGHTGIFQRKGEARYPIKEVKTISIAEMFGKTVVIKDLKSFIEEKLPEVMANQLDAAMQGWIK